MQIDPMDFVVKFLRHFDEHGLGDKLNKQTGRLEASWELMQLVRLAQQIAPIKIGAAAAARKMKELEDEARERAIEASKQKVIDMRNEFSARMAENGGAHKLVKDLAKALSIGDEVTAQELIARVKKFQNYQDGAQ